MAEIITVQELPADLQSAELIDVMVAGANARATRVAPCLAETPTTDQLAEAKLVLIGAVKRWTEAGAGAMQNFAAGGFSMGLDTRQRTGFNLWPSEITDLQAICKTGSSGAFSVDTAPSVSTLHADICALAFGALYCDCGADIAGVPIYGTSA